MKTLLRFLPFIAFAAPLLHAADAGPGPRVPGDPARYALLAPESDKVLAAVRAADDERVAAVKAGDRDRLAAIFSNELRYGHSSGHVDTKASYIEALVKHTTVYESYDYLERTFLPAAPGVVLMTGRVLIHARHDAQVTELDLNFLAVWREENGQWRFLSWQSCKAPTPPAAPAAAK